jgi:nicotinate-nucleotide adenylyltransferase
LNEHTLHAWFGGSFDPVHNGHLVAAQEVVEQLHLDQLLFTPCYLSPLKERTACVTEDRVRMLQLAIEGKDHFGLDLRELAHAGSSYTVDTLAALRAQFGNQANLLWVIGWDAYLSLPAWHKWQTLLEFCNLVVVNRPGFGKEVPEPLRAWSAGREVIKEELVYYNFGKLLFLNTSYVDIASSRIRERCARRQPITDWVPQKVATYIHEKNLFIED